MDAVIPMDVLLELREFQARTDALEGWFRSEQIREKMGWGRTKGHLVLRKLYRAGLAERKRVTLTEEQALAMGLASAGTTILWRIKEEV